MSDNPDQNLLLESYLAMIAEVAAFIGGTCPEVAAPHQEHLLRLRSRLAFASDDQTLQETREAIENELRACAERARALMDRRNDDLRRVLKAFAQVTEVLAERSTAGSHHIDRFTAQINEIADQVPWLNIRDALREVVADAASRADVLQLESQLAQAHVEEQIRVFHGRLAKCNPLHLDLLTGLGNRHAVEEQIANRLEAGRTFTLLLFRTDVEALVASSGRAAADQVLVQAASRLAVQVRAHDYVGRWSPNEFAIVMECGVENAEPRSRQIGTWLSGSYLMSGNVAERQVEASFTGRVADPGEAQGFASATAEQAAVSLPA